MKKIFNFLLFLLLLSNCSFDKKTGIWKDGEEISKKNKLIKEKEKNLITVFIESENFSKELEPPQNYKFVLSSIIENDNWPDEFLNNKNSYPNINYDNKRNITYKSNKLSSKKINPKYLVSDNNLFFSDQNGTIFVYSLTTSKVIFEYNFYKKKYKKIKKKLSIIVEDNIIFIADNIGYAYSLNYKSNKIIWAKNFGIPFRSNLKLKNNKLFLSSVSNKLYFLNAQNGEKIYDFASEKSSINTPFENNLALNENSLFYLNTSGKLHSVDIKSNNINWILNLTNKVTQVASNLFDANPLTVEKNIVLVSSNSLLLAADTQYGNIYWQIPVVSKVKPIISGELIYLLTDTNLVVCINLADGKIIWSKNVLSMLKKSNYEKVSKKIKNLKYLVIANDNILLFSNSHIIEISPLKQNVIQIKKLPFSIFSYPVFVNAKMHLLADNKKIFTLD